MNYLLDTNIISEVRKGSDCNPGVATWYDSVDEDSILPKPALLKSGLLR